MKIEEFHINQRVWYSGQDWSVFGIFYRGEVELIRGDNENNKLISIIVADLSRISSTKPKIKKEGWINISLGVAHAYAPHVSRLKIYDTEQEAKQEQHETTNPLRTIKIEWEE